MYYPEDASVAIGGNLGAKPTSQYDRTDDTSWMTETEAIEALGSKEHVEQFVATGHFVFDPATRLYRFAAQAPDLFSVTVLHEIGHAVDARIGGRTSFIYEIAGWRTYPEASFDDWAMELGGWSSVAPADQARIREVWISWMSTTAGEAAAVSVGDIVPADHPAIASRYKNVGVVQLARNRTPLSSRKPARFNDRAAIADHQRQRFMTVSMRAVHVAPSQYALTAPGEYFAECYAYYYREFDGRPETADKKGASLAPWVKDWFDTHIDKLGHMPRR